MGAVAFPHRMKVLPKLRFVSCDPSPVSEAAVMPPVIVKFVASLDEVIEASEYGLGNHGVADGGDSLVGRK